MDTSTVKQEPFLTDPTGREHFLKNEDTTIGRAVGNDIIITSKRVSREHASIRRDGWKVMLEDSGSTNGTFLNDERLIQPTALRDQDRIKIGDVIFTFHDPDITYNESVFPTLSIDTAAGIVRVDRQEIQLSAKEYALLAHLYDHSNEICSKDSIANAVWPEYQSGVYDYQVENLVRRVRTKLEPNPAEPIMLLTIRGRGYKLIITI
jgi:pSer/pThr/pTyr-binding forkhead associated (FHA) protein